MSFRESCAVGAGKANFYSYHGHNDCDAHFGRIIKSNEPYTRWKQVPYERGHEDHENATQFRMSDIHCVLFDPFSEGPFLLYARSDDARTHTPYRCKISLRSRYPSGPCSVRSYFRVHPRIQPTTPTPDPPRVRFTFNPLTPALNTLSIQKNQSRKPITKS